jgi:protein tyrosine phosphatase
LLYRIEIDINKSIIVIPLKKEAENFNYDEDLVEEEYNKLEEYVDNDSEHEDHLHEGDPDLDRYSDIKSYKHNIISINTEKKYINASPINIINDKYFISTQGPKNETIEDLWTMVEEHKCNVIVMLCKNKERGKEKCACYWKEKNDKKYSIKVLKEDKKEEDDYFIREIQIINNNTKKEKIVHQIHFVGWPDHGVPDTSDKKIFDIFNKIIELVDTYKGDGPIVTHCSAGVGRTGTFISMYFLEKEIRSQINNKVNEIKFSVFNLVRKLKEMRLYLVQTEIQYEFIYQYVEYLLKKFNK